MTCIFTKRILKMIKNKAFTLAEVLITLGIIGIVAAMTIPTLISNYQKNATISKLKDAYSIISNAVKMAEVDNGELASWKNPAVETRTERNIYFYNTYLKPYLKVVKECPETTEQCWTASTSLSNVTGYLPVSSTYTSFIVSNGMTVFFWTTNELSNVQVWVNINGLNNDAILGKDVFGFRIVINKEQSGLPYSGTFFVGDECENIEDLITDTQYGCSKDINTRYAGRYCGALIKRDGWKIRDTYPW